MKPSLLIFLFTFCVCSFALAQYPGGGGGQGRQASGARQNMNVGHMYGRVVDGKTGKGVDAATVQLTGNKFDTVAKKMKPFIFGTTLTSAHGDFSFETLPLFGNFKLHISVIGYTDSIQTVSFGIKLGGQGGQQAANSGLSQEDRMQQMIGMADKDLGNIKISPSNGNLAAVTVTATKPFFEMGIDRKIFNVDQNLVTTGQTATEVMKQIPSLNVDIDGNVTMRNATPQIFVDGRPTTLTLDEIPADLIDKVELITNPSAKYDASGGGAGILNIILKKNIKKGYNGGVRAGVDSRGKINTGADINYRQGKLNFFLTGVYNQRLTKYTNNTTKNDLNYDSIHNAYSPRDSVNNHDVGQNLGAFGFVRGGFDYFVDNRNTISLSINYNKGSFTGTDVQDIDSTINEDNYFSRSVRTTNSHNDFENFGAQLSFKHNFQKNGHDITADINYNSTSNTGFGNYNTTTQLTDGTKLEPFIQQTNTVGDSHYVVFQSDYENPITDNIKFEAGIRGQIRHYDNISDQYLGVADSALAFDQAISSNYTYTDQVYAGYLNYSYKGKKFNYQIGLRAENSEYSGVNNVSKDSVVPFNVKYPVSLFPSAFFTYKLNDGSDLQVNYTRRINRPSFFQLLPTVDLTDPQNPRKGNPGLNPEFTNSFELSYDKTYNGNANFLATAYMRYTTGLITNYYYRGLSPLAPVTGPYNANDSVQYVTYLNANSSLSYGLELINKITIARIWDLTLNANLFDSKITINPTVNQGLDVGQLTNQRVSWFGKMNNTFKLPKKFTLQLSGNYQSKTIIPQGGGQGRGGGFFGGPVASAQGYQFPLYSFDGALRKEWTWKGGNTAAVTLSMSDIFRTALYKSYSATTGDDAFNQILARRRDPQLIRLNFSYRFGKIDADLFKRKNTKADQTGGNEMAPQ